MVMLKSLSLAKRPFEGNTQLLLVFRFVAVVALIALTPAHERISA
jgi:hypothetical protein